MKSVNVTLKVCNRLNLNEHKKSVCNGRAIVEKCRGGKLITFSYLQSEIPRSSSFRCSKILRFQGLGGIFFSCALLILRSIFKSFKKVV